MEVTREQVLAFRLAGHHLDARLPADDAAGAPVGPSVAAAMALGLRTTASAGPGAALAARVAGAVQATLDALAADRTGADVLGMRASPHVVLAADWSVLTAATLPDGDASLAAALDGLRRFDGDPFAHVTPTRALTLATDAALEALAEGPLLRGELSAAMTQRLPPELSPYCPGCKTEHVGETLFRLAGAAGGYVRLLGERGRPHHCRPEEWFGPDARATRADDLAAGERAAAGRELTRRFLHAHGPSDSRGLAAWLDVAPADGAARWAALPDPLAAVRYQSRDQWVLAADLDGLLAAASREPGPPTVRLLPAYDPLLLTPDRATLVPDRADQKELWRILGNPGAVLVDGLVAGSWRAAARGKRLTVTITPFGPWDPTAQRPAVAEAELLAAARGTNLEDVVVEF